MSDDPLGQAVEIMEDEIRRLGWLNSRAILFIASYRGETAESVLSRLSPGWRDRIDFLFDPGFVRLRAHIERERRSVILGEGGSR
jgi:hypothetical protein